MIAGVWLLRSDALEVAEGCATAGSCARSRSMQPPLLLLRSSANLHRPPFLTTLHPNSPRLILLPHLILLTSPHSLPPCSPHHTLSHPSHTGGQACRRRGAAQAVGGAAGGLPHLPSHRAVPQERGWPPPAQAAALQGQMSGGVAGGMGGAGAAWPHASVCLGLPC